MTFFPTGDILKERIFLEYTMIDFHTHILPGIDDGSDSIALSLQMLRALAQQGVDTVVATPHFSALKAAPLDFVAQRNAAFESLPKEAGLPNILLGAEVAYFDSMSHCEDLPALKIGDSDLILVEMPFGMWTDRMIEDVCAIPRQQGLMPVLAHVERYARKDQFSRYRGWLEDQALFQCNAQFFLKGLDRRKALRMLSVGDIHFLGSDCHNMAGRAPNIGDALAVIRKKLGEDAITYLNDTMHAFLFGEGV